MIGYLRYWQSSKLVVDAMGGAVRSRTSWVLDEKLEENPWYPNVNSRRFRAETLIAIEALSSLNIDRDSALETGA